VAEVALSKTPPSDWLSFAMMRSFVSFNILTAIRAATADGGVGKLRPQLRAAVVSREETRMSVKVMMIA